MSASNGSDRARKETASKQSAPAARAAPATAPQTSASMLAAERERERQGRWLALGMSVALAVMISLARQIWRWMREDWTRAKVDREILRELDA